MSEHPAVRAYVRGEIEVDELERRLEQDPDAQAKPPVYITRHERVPVDWTRWATRMIAVAVLSFVVGIVTLPLGFIVPGWHAHGRKGERPRTAGR